MILLRACSLLLRIGSLPVCACFFLFAVALTLITAASAPSSPPERSGPDRRLVQWLVGHTDFRVADGAHPPGHIHSGAVRPGSRFLDSFASRTEEPGTHVLPLTVVVASEVRLTYWCFRLAAAIRHALSRGDWRISATESSSRPLRRAYNVGERALILDSPCRLDAGH